MIFVALGTQDFHFNRLLEAIDTLLVDDTIKEEVFAQTGYSTYNPKHYQCKRFMDHAEFYKYLEKCSLLITHAGTGTIISALKKKKKVIVMPRLKKFHEHVDDHQLEIASMFSEKGLICSAKDKIELKKIILEIDKFQPTEFVSGKNDIVDIINGFIDLNF